MNKPKAVEAFRKKKVTPKQKFKFSAMRETATSCAEALYKAISKQNPDVDLDDLESDLRALVLKHGNGTTDSEVAPAPAPEETVANVKAPYSLSGDMLVIAYDAAKAGDWRSAFKSFASAMEADDADDLIGGIEEMNANTQEALDAANMDDASDEEDMDEEVQPSDMEGAIDAIASEMEYSEEYDDVDDHTDSSSADIPDFDVPDDEENDEADEEPISVDDTKPMGGTSSSRQTLSSKKPTPVDAKLRALANKLSIDGTDESLKDSRRILAKRRAA